MIGMEKIIVVLPLIGTIRKVTSMSQYLGMYNAPLHVLTAPNQ